MGGTFRHLILLQKVVGNGELMEDSWRMEECVIFCV